MTDNHPITPSEEVVDGWESEWHHYNGKDTYEMFMAKLAARWGADQELEWCVSYVDNSVSGNKARALRAYRRPKPPSLKEQALAELDLLRGDANAHGLGFDAPAIRSALESLPD